MQEGFDFQTQVRLTMEMFLYMGLISEMPEVYRQLKNVCEKLENHFEEPQDVEFTVEKSRLYILQTRAARMNPVAQVKSSVDMYHEGLITRIAALERIDPEGLEQILYRRIAPHSKQKAVATGSRALRNQSNAWSQRSQDGNIFSRDL